MRWNKFGKQQAALGTALLLLCALLVSVADPERQLTVYTPQKSFTVEIQDRQGQLYLNLLDLLGPIGTAEIHPEGKEWRLRFNGVDGVFADGSNTARLRGKSVDLGGKALVETNHVLIPLRASYPVLNNLLKAPVELHPDGRRIFIDNAATRFTAELKKSDRSSLLLNFDHPVSPAVVQEDNKVRLTFKRDPVISDITNQPWDDKTIQSLRFSEDNGAALLTISGAPGLNATVSSDGRSIVVQLPAPVVAAPAPPPPTTATPQAAPAPAPTAPAQPTQAPADATAGHPAPAFFVMIDPAHGGDDQGGVLSDKLLEKDVTLALAWRLKAELQERGIAARLLRDSDTTLPLDRRAELTNAEHAAVYVALHAGLPGGGVRVYSSAAVSPAPSPGRFLLWDRAQANYLARSRGLAKAVVGALAKKSLKVSALSTPLRPLNNINAPAIAVELAADPENVRNVMEQRFQTAVAAGIASEIAQQRNQWEKQP